MITAARKKGDESGQALIELIIFLPLMFGLYGMIRGFANAINGSINQQKVTRAYYYFRIQNNSMVPRPATGIAQNWNMFGMSYVGWAERLENDIYPISTCYQITIPLTPAPTDRCETSYSGDSSQFIRVGTVYGICGATFAAEQSTGQFFMVPDSGGWDFASLIAQDACMIK